MKKTLLFFLSISVSLLFGQVTKKVFFVGNSYTQYNDLPNIVSQMATASGDVLQYQSHTPGGSTIMQHANNPQVTSTIAQGTWDYVVLQEQSQHPTFPETQFGTDTYAPAKQIVDRVKLQNPCGNVIYYMTWGYQYGDSSLCNSLPYVCTYEGMDDKIYQRYMQLGEYTEGIVSPVGRVWRAIRNQYPSYNLYDADNSHPSYLGSMAAAYTFYTIIFKKDPSQLNFSGNLTVAEAQNIKNIVKNTVFDAMNTWFVGDNDVHSNFSHTYLSLTPFQLQFNNTTPNATTFLWNFGDGTTSTLENPIHTFLTHGVYQVSLTTNACPTNPTKTRTFQLHTLSTQEASLPKIEVYPNPTSNNLNIKTNSDIKNIQILDFSGRKINMKWKKDQNHLSTSLEQLPAGVYTVQFTFKNKIYTEKIIKN